MPLPIKLGVGFVSIYGASSLNNISSYNPNFISGVVDNVYVGSPANVSIGQYVFIDKTKADNFTFDGNEYYVLPQDNILFVENEPEES